MNEQTRKEQADRQTDERENERRMIETSRKKQKQQTRQIDK
jgi:hypothetical protein